MTCNSNRLLRITMLVSDVWSSLIPAPLKNQVYCVRVSPFTSLSPKSSRLVTPAVPLISSRA